MADLPTPEENASAVLAIFAHFNLRAGEVLRPNNFMAVADSRGLRWDDIISGLEEGVELGWFEETDKGSVSLTDAGFAAMRGSRGLYVIEFGAELGISAGVLYIGDGVIAGTDVGKVRYEGTYVEEGDRIKAEIAITATGSGAQLVTGVALQGGRSLAVIADLPRDFANGDAHPVHVGGQEVLVTLEKIINSPRPA